MGTLGREDAACLSRSGRGPRRPRWSIRPGERTSSRARARLADRHARRRESARGPVRVFAPRRHLHAGPSEGFGLTDDRTPSHSHIDRPVPAEGHDEIRELSPIVPVRDRTAEPGFLRPGVSSSHCAAKSVVVPGRAVHLCYCHSPMRMRGTSSTPISVRRVLDDSRAAGCIDLCCRGWLGGMRQRQARASFRGQLERTLPAGSADTIIVSQRSCIRPSTRFLSSRRRRTGDYFLIVSALVPYKRYRSGHRGVRNDRRTAPYRRRRSRAGNASSRLAGPRVTFPRLACPTEVGSRRYRRRAA